MGKPDAPDTPNPRETAAATTGTNVGTAIANAFLNNVNQVGPGGSVSYAPTGSHQYKDPYTGKSYDIPTFTATTELSGANKNIYDLAEQQSGFLKDYMATPVDLSTANVENYINTHFTDDFNKRWDTDRGRLETDLANRGVRMGSDAYTRALEDFDTRRSGAYDNLYGNQYGLAQQSLLTERNQPINEITSLLSGSQIAVPGFQHNASPIPTADVAGIINQDFQNRYGNYESRLGSWNDIMGGLFGLGKAAIGAIPSDERVKEDIRKVGETDDGTPIYTYRYKTGGPTEMGVMAQDLLEKHPEAVSVLSGGILGVDYNLVLGRGS